MVHAQLNQRIVRAARMKIAHGVVVTCSADRHNGSLIGNVSQAAAPIST